MTISNMQTTWKERKRDSVQYGVWKYPDTEDNSMIR